MLLANHCLDVTQTYYLASFSIWRHTFTSYMISLIYYPTTDLAKFLSIKP